MLMAKLLLSIHSFSPKANLPGVWQVIAAVQKVLYFSVCLLIQPQVDLVTFAIETLNSQEKFKKNFFRPGLRAPLKSGGELWEGLCTVYPLDAFALTVVLSFMFFVSWKEFQ